MYQLTVTTPDKDIFDAYYYGYGEIVRQEIVDNFLETVIYYGNDAYRCEYQAGRFASGLYFARVEEI